LVTALGHALIRAYRRARISFDWARHAVIEFIDLGVPVAYGKWLPVAASSMTWS
jgi:hypothetical protein